MRLAIAVLLSAAALSAEPAAPLDRVFDRMYRNDFASAKAMAQAYIESHPRDPLGYSVQSAAYLFAELDRLSILESEFFKDDKRIADKKRGKPDPLAREAVFSSIGKARELAAAQLQASSQEKNALFALCIATGVQTDYLALVEKRQFSSLSYARESQSWAVKLLAIDPNYSDAYLTTGLSEYLLGSMPFFVKWFVRFENTQGSKTQAVRNLELVARSGRYFGPFAKVLLAIIHLREKRPADARMRLAELAREFPENDLFQRELAKLAMRPAPVPAGRP